MMRILNVEIENKVRSFVSHSRLAIHLTKKKAEKSFINYRFGNITHNEALIIIPIKIKYFVSFETH